MRWNVILRTDSKGDLGVFNIFDDSDFRLDVEKLISKDYDKKQFSKELDLIAHFHFWSKIEWETIFTTWPPYINEDELNRLVTEYHTNRKPGQPLPERIDVKLDRMHKIDIYAQLRMNWERFCDYVWTESRK